MTEWTNSNSVLSFSSSTTPILLIFKNDVIITYVPRRHYCCCCRFMAYTHITLFVVASQSIWRQTDRQTERHFLEGRKEGNQTQYLTDWLTDWLTDSAFSLDVYVYGTYTVYRVVMILPCDFVTCVSVRTYAYPADCLNYYASNQLDLIESYTLYGCLGSTQYLFILVRTMMWGWKLPIYCFSTEFVYILSQGLPFCK